MCITASSPFLHFPLICRLWSPAGVPPSSRTIITLVCDPSRVAGKEMNSKLGLQGLEYYLVQTKPACSSLHSFTPSDWCWQFPQMKLCQGNTWSMTLVAQILTSIRPPQSNLFLPTTQNSWCPCSIQSCGEILDARKNLCCFIHFNSCDSSIYIKSKLWFQLVK